MARLTVFILALLCSASLHAADSGTIASNTQLFDQPAGQVVGTLLANTLVEVGERRDGWYRVSATGGRQGWVRIGAVRFAGQRQSESVFGGLWGWLNSGRPAQTGGTATAGIRGLDAGDIEAAVPDHAAVQRLEGLAVSADTARQYAAALPLNARSVPALK
jgi:hypothetical protein